MVNVNEIAPFPNVGVQLLKEEEQVAVWQEMFEPDTPTSPHRHMRDYIAIFPNGGELTIVPVAGEAEDFTTLAGDFTEAPAENGGDTFSHECRDDDACTRASGRHWPLCGESRASAYAHDSHRNQGNRNREKGKVTLTAGGSDDNDNLYIHSWSGLSLYCGDLTESRVDGR